MKKVLLVIIAILLCAVLLVGCGSTDKDTANSVDSESSASSDSSKNNTSSTSSQMTDDQMKMSGYLGAFSYKINHFKELGADIPYMFFETPAVVEGIGEIITPLEPIDLSRFIVVYPEIEVITKKVFENNSKYSEKLSLEEIKRHVGIDADIYENDLEQTTSKLFYKWGVIKKALSKYGKVWMTGSGSCLVIYINGERKSIIKEIKKTLPNVRAL